jgi:FAD/FMN-containing dehydrogenase
LETGRADSIRLPERRRFLIAAGALTALLAACQTPSAQRPPSTPTPRPAPSAGEWASLAAGLAGQLVRPGDATYETARLLFNRRFDGARPAGVAYCRSEADVQACLAFARRFAVELAVRGGGHSYAGWSTSTGLVLDVSNLSAVAVDQAAGTAVVGAGARLIDVYAELARHGLALPAGSCPTVGIAGLTLGGGVGVIGRKFGLTCDNLLGARVVAAGGRVLTCDAGHEPDLFWALRGGGGGNFGVVTSFTFRVHPVSSLALFTLDWPWSRAAAMVGAWQTWAPAAPDELWSSCLLLSSADKRAGPAARVNGAYVGPAADLPRLLRPLTDAAGAPSRRSTGDVPLLDAMLVEAGCSGKTPAACHLADLDPQGTVRRDTFAARSDFFTAALPGAAINELVGTVERRQADARLGDGGIGFDAFGGAINRVAPAATAFVHRGALFSAQYSASWQPADAADTVSANAAWLNAAWRAMRPYASGFAYQNYVDPDLADWQRAYYGANLDRLRRVKAAYDPGGLFRFPQGIPRGPLG